MRLIIFDWGDTVMRVFPASRGHMARWPQVEAVPGIADALAALRPRYRLVLATNAAESGEALVRAALARVGLEERFDGVFTARELGVRKPDPAFFQAVLERMACPPGQAAMVGDEYAADVAGAKAVGLRAVWFNPSGCWPVAHPLHDAEVHSLDALPAALEQLRLPDLPACLALLAGQELPPEGVAHARAVALHAFRLALALRESGVALDPLLTHRGGLLHDLDKATCHRLGRAHGELAADLLQALGHGDLAAIARRHLISTILDPESAPQSWEEKLVYYADKVVDGDRLVGLEARIQALCRRYPHRAAQMRACRPAIADLEKEIEARLGAALTAPAPGSR